MTMNSQPIPPLAFTNYCRDFYEIGRKGVIYPIADGDQIKRAVNVYMGAVADPHHPWNWGDGDSVDRERVRSIIEDDQ
jgi:hypothetical protein